jgi:hypothetical protein
MGRSSNFAPGRLPSHLLANRVLQSSPSGTKGPISFLNPTRLSFQRRRHGASKDESEPLENSSRLDESADEQPADDVNFKWTSRNNRKGRHQLEVKNASDPSTASYLTPQSTSKPREVLRTVWRMFVSYPVWDISWIVAYLFEWGSIVWVINAL